jgi:hypothetical protein
MKTMIMVSSSYFVFCYSELERLKQPSICKRVAKLIAPACDGSSLGSNLDIQQNLQKGDINKGVANTL